MAQWVTQSVSDNVTYWAVRWQLKNTNDDNDGCNNNYDGNFDDNDNKKLPTKIQMIRVLGNKYQF